MGWPRIIAPKRGKTFEQVELRNEGFNVERPGEDERHAKHIVSNRRDQASRAADHHGAPQPLIPKRPVGCGEGRENQERR